MATKKPAKKVPARKRANPKGRTATEPKARRTLHPNRFEARMAKAVLICEAYRTGERSIANCCDEQGISDRTWYEWCYAHSEIAELYKKASEEHFKRRYDGMKPKALNSFERLLLGYEDEEVVQTAKVIVTPDGKQQFVPDTITKRKKQVPPHPTMVAMAMNNWHGMRQNINLQGKITHEQELTDEDVERIAREVVAVRED
jgi:hypothetical protein